MSPLKRGTRIVAVSRKGYLVNGVAQTWNSSLAGEHGKSAVCGDLSAL